MRHIRKKCDLVAISEFWHVVILSVAGVLVHHLLERWGEGGKEKWYGSAWELSPRSRTRCRSLHFLSRVAQACRQSKFKQSNYRISAEGDFLEIWGSKIGFLGVYKSTSFISQPNREPTFWQPEGMQNRLTYTSPLILKFRKMSLEIFDLDFLIFARQHDYDRICENNLSPTTKKKLMLLS